MADTANQNPDAPSTTVPDPDADLAALIDKRFAAWRLTRETDDEEADSVYDELDRLDALIATTPASSLTAVRLKAKVCRAIACSDAELGWPMLHSVMRDLHRAPLDDHAMLRSVFAELTAPVPPEFRKIAAVMLKPIWPRLSNDEWLAAIDRCVDALRSLDGSNMPEDDFKSFARTVVEPIRHALDEVEFAKAIDKLTNSMRGFCAKRQDDAH